MKSLILKPVDYSDLPAIMKLSNECLKMGIQWRKFKECDLAYLVAREKTFFLKIIIGKKFAGFLLLEPPRSHSGIPNSSEITIALTKAFRGKRYAAKAVRLAISKIPKKQKNFDVIIADNCVASTKLFCRMGFKHKLAKYVFRRK